MTRRGCPSVLGGGTTLFSSQLCDLYTMPSSIFFWIISFFIFSEGMQVQVWIYFITIYFSSIPLVHSWQ